MEEKKRTEVLLYDNRRTGRAADRSVSCRRDEGTISLLYSEADQRGPGVAQ